MVVGEGGMGLTDTKCPMCCRRGAIPGEPRGGHTLGNSIIIGSIMDCLFGAKPLSEPLLVYYLQGNWE